MRPSKHRTHEVMEGAVPLTVASRFYVVGSLALSLARSVTCLPDGEKDAAANEEVQRGRAPSRGVGRCGSWGRHRHPSPAAHSKGKSAWAEGGTWQTPRSASFSPGLPVVYPLVYPSSASITASTRTRWGHRAGTGRSPSYAAKEHWGRGHSHEMRDALCVFASPKILSLGTSFDHLTRAARRKSNSEPF